MTSHENHATRMETLHTTIPEDLIRKIFGHVRESVVKDDHNHDRGILLSQMDYVPTLASQADERIKQIDSAWIDSLNERNQTNCKEYKEFEANWTDDAVKEILYKNYLNTSPEMVSEKKKSILREKELEIVKKNVEKLKLFMNKYQSDPELLEKISEKLNSIIRNYYAKHGHIGFHDGAHPEYVLNAFIYNPSKTETRFKVLGINGTHVTYQPLRNENPDGLPRTIGLDAFLKTRITAHGFGREIPIGEVYGIFPYRYEYDTDESYDARVNYYLEHLMTVFAKNPSSEVFSVPRLHYVPPVKPRSSVVHDKTPPKKWVQVGEEWIRIGGYKNFNGKRSNRVRHNKKKKRTYKRRK